MNRSRRAIWLVAAAAGGGVLCLAVALFRLPRPGVASPVPPAAGLRLGPARGGAGDPLFEEEASLRDPTPLFLPTEWNSSEKEIREDKGEAAFAPYEPKPVFNPDKLGLNLPPVVAVPAGPAEALEQNPPGHPFLGMGREEDRVPALAPRSVFVAITVVGNGTRVFSQPVAGLASGLADFPPGEGAWEFLAAVDAAGLVGPLVETVRSGTPADDYFVDYLTETLRVGLRLSPGFYRISVGP
jgi:hypothetical protein